MYPHDPNQQPTEQLPQPQTPPLPPNQTYSVDYLDQISAPVKTSPIANPKFIYGIIGGLLALLVLVGGLLFLGSQPSPMDKSTDMLLRMQTLEKVARAQHSHLRDGQLRATNSSYLLFLANAIRDIKEPLDNAGVNVNQLPKEQRDSEKTLETELKEQFDEARLNVLLDRTYAREMNYQLDILHGMMVSVYNATNNTVLTEYLETTENNLGQVSDGFSNFSGSK